VVTILSVELRTVIASHATGGGEPAGADQRMLDCAHWMALLR
jgi:hypothetical protein